MEMKRQERPDKDVAPLFGSMYLRRIKQRIGRLLIPRLPISPHVLWHIRQMNVSWVVRLNNKINPVYLIKKAKLKRGKELSVNLACGMTGKPGWINLDLTDQDNLYFKYDCRQELPLKDGTAIRIRCEHFLEHLDYPQEALVLLKGCYRSLKPGGALRVIVPDGGRFLRAYQTGRKEDWLDLGWDLDNLPDDFRTQMDVINHVFRQNADHLYAYDFETLALLLRTAGFAKIQKSEFGVSFDPELCADVAENRLHSLYIEAVR